MTQVGAPKSRAMSDEERAVLERALAAYPTAWMQWKHAAENALVQASVFMLLFFVAWFAIAWVSRKLFQWEVGQRSAWALWIVAAGILASAAFALASSVRWIRGSGDWRPALRADLDAGQVMDEHYRFTAAKRFKDDDYGLLVYFLRTTEGRVLMLHDREHRAHLRHGPAHPPSTLQVRAELLLVRAPVCDWVVRRQFSGALLEVREPTDLAIERLPNADEAYCDVPWEELEARLALPNVEPKLRAKS